MAATEFTMHGLTPVSSNVSWIVCSSGRQPNPNQQEFDAYLYAYQLDTTVSASPLALLGAAYAPFR